MANEKIVNRENLKAFRQANDERYKSGQVVVGQAKTIKAVSDESGTTQETPFILQGTGTANGTSIVDTSPIGKQLEKQGNTVAVNQLVNTGDTEVSTISGHKYWTYINGTIAKVDSTGANIELNDANIDKVVDLTQWFGSNDNIPPDLLYNPSNFFRYYNGSLAYNTGALINCDGRYLVCGGRNLFDGENDIKAISNATYYCYGSNITLTYKDSDGNTILSETKSNETFIAPSNCDKIGVSGSGNITISLYYTTGDNYDQYYAYEQPKVYDTGTEVLRSAGSVKDYKEPNGTIHRLVGTRAYQSGDENDTSVITDMTNTYYPLETPTTEQGTPFSENIEINDYGTMGWLDSNNAYVDIPQGCKIFYPADYVLFIDSLGQREDIDWDASEIVSQSELSASETQRDTIDTQLKNAVGGTLRQLLAVSKSIDFNNTDWVYLGELNWTKQTAYGIQEFYSSGIANLVKHVSSASDVANIICTKYKSAGRNSTQVNTISIGQEGNVYIKDQSDISTDQFKNAMKGVLLAYEKASS